MNQNAKQGNADVVAVLLALHNQAHLLEKSERTSDKICLSRISLAVSINMKESLSTEMHWIG